MRTKVPFLYNAENGNSRGTYDDGQSSANERDFIVKRDGLSGAMFWGPAAIPIGRFSIVAADLDLPPDEGDPEPPSSAPVDVRVIPEKCYKCQPGVGCAEQRSQTLRNSRVI